MDNVTNTPAVRRKTKPKGRHPNNALSATFVLSAPPGRHCDGNGLYFYVQRTGTRSWIPRLVIWGRKRELGFSSVALVSLAKAREKALANRKPARAGCECGQGGRVGVLVSGARRPRGAAKYVGR